MEGNICLLDSESTESFVLQRVGHISRIESTGRYFALRVIDRLWDICSDLTDHDNPAA
jgi:hypothetical protein